MFIYLLQILFNLQVLKNAVFSVCMCSNVSYWHSFDLLPVPIANGSTIDVWIQGEKYAGGYIFHDGSPFPTDFGTGTFCPVELNSDPNEIRFRAHGSTTFECWDRAQHHLYSYLCEYSRRFTI